MTAYVPSRERLTFYGGGAGYDALEYQTITFILTDWARINNRITADIDNCEPPPLQRAGMDVEVIIDRTGRIWLSYVQVSLFLYPTEGDNDFHFDLRPYLDPPVQTEMSNTSDVAPPSL